jgi:futalosine hydrolase
VAGSFDPEIEQGSLLNVQRDRFSDFGVETHDGFIPGEKLPFSLLDRLPYHEGWLILSAPAKYQPAGLEICSAITSDTVHTTEASVQYLRDLFQPDIESMEGAAFTFTCLQSGIPCIQIRSVSNMVGPHNEANWQLELAIASLNTFLKEYLDETR